MVISTVLFVACGNDNKTEQTAKAEQQIENAHKTRNYSRLIALADSLGEAGILPQSEACYWMGYASDRMKQQRMAEFYWKSSLQAASNSTDEKDIEYYTKSASRLANLLTVRGEYEEALKAIIPTAERIEELKCDTTSDYINLLIYIGCCQAGLGNTGESTNDGFDRAYQKHLENIEKNRTDESYKNAIAGLINIAFACNTTHAYNNALKWTANFGELLSEYEQRPGTDPDYIDKQVARFNIYQALALEGLGRSEEAAKVYEESFLKTAYSQTPEGRIMANDYLIAAKRWDEAANNYKSLDELMDARREAYTLDNIQDLVLKKYQTNLISGRRDSAVAISMQICDSLENAFAQAKKLNAKEQVIIVREVEKMTQQQEDAQKKNRMGLLGVFAVAMIGFLAYIFYRRYAFQKMKSDYSDLQEEYNQLESRTADEERVKTEKIVVSDTQAAVLPKKLPQGKHFEIIASMIPASELGGNFYDSLLQNDKLYFCIGDASGKGSHISVLLGMVKPLFRSAVSLEADPLHIVTAINKTFIETGNEEMAMTLFVGMLDLSDGSLSYCNAGHKAPVIANPEISLLPTDENRPVGVKDNYPFIQQELTLEPNTILFFYSAGMINAKSKDQRRYGEKRILGTALQAIKTNSALTAFMESMLNDVKHYTGDKEQKADITMLGIKYQP